MDGCNPPVVHCPRSLRLIEANLLGDRPPLHSCCALPTTISQWFCCDVLPADCIVPLDLVSDFWCPFVSSIQGGQHSNLHVLVQSLLIHNHIYQGVDASLAEQQRLTPGYRLSFARQFYRELPVLALFSPTRSWHTLRCMMKLQSGLQPDSLLEPSLSMWRVIVWLGIKGSLQLDPWLLFLPDQLHFGSGGMRISQL